MLGDQLRVDLMAPNVLFGVALANSDDSAVVTALDQVAPKVLRHPLQRRFANLALHLADGLRGKVPNHPAVAVENFSSIVHQPVAD